MRDPPIIVFTAHERFLNCYGEKHARLNGDQSVFDETKRTWFMSLFSPFLLYAPEPYLKKIQLLVVDSLVKKSSWGKLISELTDEWRECTLFVRTCCASCLYLLIHTSTSLGYRIVDFKCLLLGYSIVR